MLEYEEEEPLSADTALVWVCVVGFCVDLVEADLFIELLFLSKFARGALVLGCKGYPCRGKAESITLGSLSSRMSDNGLGPLFGCCKGGGGGTGKGCGDSTSASTTCGLEML